MSYSVRNIAIALVLAALAAVLVIVYTGNVQKQADERQSTTPVLVAARDIPPGTSVADAIRQGMFQVRPIVQRDVVPGALDSEKRLNRDRAVATTIPANAQVTMAMFRDSNANPIGQQITGQNRAIQIALNANMVLNGTLTAGDHIDLIGTFGDSAANGFSRVILSDVEVLSVQQSGAAAAALAADSSTGGGSDGTGGAAVILEVPKAEVAKVTYALAFGNGLWFLLRPEAGDNSGGLTPFANLESTVLDGLNSTQKSKVEKALEANQ
jgi:Flp pilus assembly protein CpaB